MDSPVCPQTPGARIRALGFAKRFAARGRALTALRLNVFIHEAASYP